MGGVRKNENFILNCLGWEKLRRENPEVHKKIENLLEKNHINVTVRREMGRDIDAACGQLRNKAEER